MLSSLRARLLFSYIAVISVTLCIVGTALVFILLGSQLPARQTYERLSGIARSNRLTLIANLDRLDETLSEIAATNDIRILRVSPESVVLFDSEGQFSAGQVLQLRALQSASDNTLRGTYRGPDGRLWLFVAFEPQEEYRDLGTFVFAAPRPRILVSFFGEGLLRPFLQAAAIGLVLSVILGALITNSVASPLRRTASAARAIAGGDYATRAPEEGPREVRELAQSFNEMAQQVQRTQQTQRDFLANVSHELKTPLTSIQGYSQAILDGAAAQPGHAARVIYDEAARMHRLVEDLLDLARIESGQTPFRREHVQLAELLQAVVERLSLRAAEQGILLSSAVSPIPRVTGDSDRLAQVFTNLVDNAITHTPTGGQVALRAGPRDGGVEVVVSDTGKGIPPADLSRVFERFYQVDKSRARSRIARQGTGLGLTICKEIIEAHGGKIRAESAENQGATFCVWLPLPRPIDETVPRLERS